MKIKKHLNPKAQSTLEYAILVVIIIGVLLAMQVYIKRGLQGRLKSSTDDIGEQYSVGEGGSYTKKTHTNSKTIEESKGGVSNTNTVHSITTTNVTARWATTEEFFSNAVEGEASGDASGDVIGEE